MLVRVAGFGVYGLDGLPIAQIHHNRTKQVGSGAAFPDRDHGQAKYVISDPYGPAKRQPDKVPILIVDLQLVLGIYCQDGKRDKAETRILHTLQENQRLAVLKLERQKPPALFKTR